ncbi:hypothetical protein SAFG77S_04654 [Streptomyces afghaniensis]
MTEASAPAQHLTEPLAPPPINQDTPGPAGRGEGWRVLEAVAEYQLVTVLETPTIFGTFNDEDKVLRHASDTPLGLISYVRLRPGAGLRPARQRASADSLNTGLAPAPQPRSAGQAVRAGPTPLPLRPLSRMDGPAPDTQAPVPSRARGAARRCPRKPLRKVSSFRLELE